MGNTSGWARRARVLAAIIGVSGLTTTAIAKKPPRPSPPPPEPPACTVPQPGYVMFLDDYPLGRFHMAALPCLSDNQIGLVSPRELTLDLPRKDLRTFQIANGDVYLDRGSGVRWMVFGGRTGPSDHWGIYTGIVDVPNGIIRDIGPLVSTPGVREEDPRFNTDGSQIVYKCGGKICLIDTQKQAAVFHQQEGCELWAPSMYLNVAISYTRRCGDDPLSDRIVYHPVGSPEGIEVWNGGEGPDRFAHFTARGDLVYSHVDADDKASLWMYLPYTGRIFLHDETNSDDDPYAERDGNSYVAFSGWGSDRYDLYVFRAQSGTAVRLTDGVNVLGPILFD